MYYIIMPHSYYAHVCHFTMMRAGSYKKITNNCTKNAVFMISNNFNFKSQKRRIFQFNIPNCLRTVKHVYFLVFQWFYLVFQVRIEHATTRLAELIPGANHCTTSPRIPNAYKKNCTKGFIFGSLGSSPLPSDW